MKVKQAIEILKAHGWEFERHGKGDHDHYSHPENLNLVTVDGKPSDDIPRERLQVCAALQELRS